MSLAVCCYNTKGMVIVFYNVHVLTFVPKIGQLLQNKF